MLGNPNDEYIEYVSFHAQTRFLQLIIYVQIIYKESISRSKNVRTQDADANRVSS